MQRPPVSLVLTVLNEARSLSELLDSIAAQTCAPDEVVVCDGGSRDGTVDVLRGEQRFPITVVVAPGANISTGRNRAIAAARGPVIACTDAGVRLEPAWLERITAPWQPGDGPAVSAGFFVPDARTPFEVAMGATVLPAASDISPATFLPSSRSVAFTKAAWAAVGGYPEWLDYCEDLIFDLNLRRAFGPFAFTPDAVAHFRPRGSFKSFFKQYYLYARGDGKANLFLKRHLIRYATYLLAAPALIAGMIGGAAASSPALSAASALAFFAGAAAYTRTPYRRLAALAAGLSPLGRAQAAACVPLIRLVGDAGKMAGYPAGVLWRVRRRGKDRQAAAPAPPANR